MRQGRIFSFFRHARIQYGSPPGFREAEQQLTQKDLDELRRNLAHLSVDAVLRFYDRAHEDCRMIYGRLGAPSRVHLYVVKGM